ncbi:MAG: dihydrodipicolinate synthase family protein [Planctomycetota bacterium]
MSTEEIDPQKLLTPRRKPQGITAVLLPYTKGDEVDWPGFEGLLRRTTDAGLTPAVNMDTGYANLIDEATRQRVLQTTRQVTGDLAFVAGAYVQDQPGDAFNADAYATQIESIQEHGGIPVIFQSYGLAHQADDAILENYRRIASMTGEFIAFELGNAFAPFGNIYSLGAYEQLMQIPQCSGAKHSSLNRVEEWRRLALRNRVRPDFRVYTGNDLAIDMIAYGSDYLLGLSSFAPDVFALRDRLWAEGDPRWNEWNDWLQYLGFLAFRPAVPAYKHSAAMFLHARGWIDSPRTHPASPTRSEADRELLTQLAERIEARLTDFNSKA